MTILLPCLAVMVAAAQPEVHIAKYYGDREAALTFTFDDGLQEHYTEVFPRLKKCGLKASFGIIGSRVGKAHKGIPCMNWGQLREMSADGQEITSHGFRHQSLEKLTGETLRYEVQHNDTLIYDSVGRFPRTYFYPGNRKTDEGVTFCSQGRVGTRMSQVSFGSKRDTVWTRRMLDRTLKNGEWTVLMTHGISMGYDAFANPVLLWDTMEKAAAMRDQIWVATLHDVLAYIAERDAVQTEVAVQGDNIIVTLRNTLDNTIYNHPLTMVIDTDITEARQDGKRLPMMKKDGRTLLDIDPNGGNIQIKRTP